MPGRGVRFDPVPRRLPRPPQRPQEGDYREVRHRRGLDDVRAIAVWLAVVVVGLGFATVASGTMSGVAGDLRAGASRLPHPLLAVVLVVVQVVYLAVLTVTPLVLLVLRRWGLLGRGALALLLAPSAFGLVTLLPAVRSSAPVTPQGEDLLQLVRVDWPPTSALASATALTVATTTRLPRRWRRAAWALLAVLVVLRVVTASSAPLDVVLAVGVGGTVGAVLTLALGRTEQELTPTGARHVLAAAGIEALDRPAEGDGPTQTLRARTPHGPVEVRVHGEGRWRGRIEKAYRRLRWRDVGDELGTRTPAQAVTAEAAVLLLAGAHGVRVPRVRAVTRAPHGESVLVVDAPDLTPLDRLDPLDDVTLRAAWQQVVGLRAARVAHRDLRLGVLGADPSGDVWLTGLEDGLPAADDATLGWDVAELLASSGAVVGPERAVAAAVDVLGADVVADALPRLVPAGLSSATRGALRATPDGIAPLVAEVVRVTDAEQPDVETVARFRPRTLVTAAFLVVAMYFLAPQLVDLPTTLRQLGGVSWWWIPAVLAASAATYVGAALGLAGGTPGRVPVGEAGAVALASSFVATFAPPGVGQVGLNIRFLQKRGYPTPVAVSASAAKEAAVLVVHLVLLVTFAVLAGSTGALSQELDRLPPGHVVAAVAVAVLAVVGIALAVPRLRALLRGRLVPAVRSSVDAMRDVARSPLKLVMLLGGVTLLPLGFAACLWCSVEALGGHVGFVPVALVSLTAGAVATAAPTPGGLGAVEAVLLGALTGIGVASGTALAGVLLYRLATFWLPIAPGAVAFRTLTRRSVL